MGAPDCRFEIIHAAMEEPNNRLSVSEMCALAGVSRSGYYNWLSSAGTRLKREIKDQEDFALILAAYEFRGYAKGVRGINMRLLHMGVVMNPKKIRRLMRKYNLFCPIRKANPYRRMAKAMRTNNVADNLLNREFESHGPRRVLLTDITYIPLNGEFCYLSTILDAFTKQILAYDETLRQQKRIEKERDYFTTDQEALDIFKAIATIMVMPKPYDRIGELPDLISKFKQKYNALLDVKKQEVGETIRQSMADVHQLAMDARDAGSLLKQADDYFVNKREAVKIASSLTDLDAMITQVLTFKDTILRRMELLVSTGGGSTGGGNGSVVQTPPKKKVTSVRRYDLCAVKRLQTAEDVDAYVEAIRKKLLRALEDSDGVQIS